MKRIAVAVSGGTDSLYSLVSLHDQGYEVLALHGRFLPPSSSKPDPIPALERVCAALGISLHVRDLISVFDDVVVDPFVRQYATGLTPNPCVLCNARLKFGALLDAALALGADYLATGHYAALTNHWRYGKALARAADKGKDQSYFLSLTSAERLFKAVFPMAAMHKRDAAAALSARGIAVPLPQESQEICFVPGDRYRPFLEEQARKRNLSLGGSGPMLLHAGTEQERLLGRHEGLWRHTEGQRRGLGVAYSEPLYVVGKDRARNALLLGTREDLRMRRCTVEGLNMLVAPELWPERLYARVRYRQEPAPADAVLRPGAAGGQALDICFTTPHSPTAPGQTAVLYDEEGVALAGGVVTAIE